MPMISRNPFSVVLLLAIFAGPGYASNACCIPVSVELSVGAPIDGQPTLRAKLRNTSGQAITVDGSRLPWGNRYSITLLAVPERSQPLLLLFPIDDPMKEDVTIKPGESLEGTIRLGSFFRGIADAVKKSPVLVLWSYQLKTVDGEQSERITGAVQLSSVANAPPTGQR
jgi:hypothetical protein